MQDRFERFVVSITELHRYLQKLKELEMGQLDLKAGYTMCLYHLGKHPEDMDETTCQTYAYYVNTKKENQWK